MQAFIVGGAVRDELLGLPVKDRDWVVVGATPDEMLARGFRPVGKDFPVFLHPETGEEYALARTERKTGRGYKGFSFHTSPDVSLEEDLLRRDLTINAMARTDDGRLIDPYGGRRDLEKKIFRHVSPAFAEDPVRVLRVARFAARLEGFSLAPETLALMRDMVTDGEVDHLVAERVWQELARGLMEAAPSRMLAMLRECGALARILPELDRLFALPGRGEHVLAVLDVAAGRHAPLEVRWACLLHDLDSGGIRIQEDDASHHAPADLARAVSERLKAPNECRELAILLARERQQVHAAPAFSAAEVVKLLERTDALRRPERFVLLLDAAACEYGAHADRTEPDYAPAAFLQNALKTLQAVDSGAIARACLDKSEIPGAIRAARVAALDPHR